MVRLTQKSACMILVGIRKKLTREILIFRFLPILRQPKSQKMAFFSDWAAEPPQKIAKNQNFKNSRVSFVELYLRINHVKFYIDWIIFQRLDPKLVIKKKSWNNGFLSYGSRFSAIFAIKTHTKCVNMINVALEYKMNP